MTPREAAALQRRKPQLPGGWPIPDHPANRPPPPRANDPLVAHTLQDRVLSALEAIAARGGTLPYYNDLAGRCGMTKRQLIGALGNLTVMGQIRRFVGHSNKDFDCEWICEVSGRDGLVTLRSEGAGSLDWPVVVTRARGTIQNHVLDSLVDWEGPLPTITEFSAEIKVRVKSVGDALRLMKMQERIEYDTIQRGGNQPMLWRVVVDGVVRQSKEWPR